MTIKERNQLCQNALNSLNGTAETETLMDEAVPLGEVTIETQLDRMNQNLEFQNEFYGLMGGVVIVVFIIAVVLILSKTFSNLFRGA